MQSFALCTGGGGRAANGGGEAVGPSTSMGAPHTPSSSAPQTSGPPHFYTPALAYVPVSLASPPAEAAAVMLAQDRILLEETLRCAK